MNSCKSKQEVSTLFKQMMQNNYQLYYENDLEKERLLRFISEKDKVKDIEAPDAYIEIGNIIYIIEHFKVSSYNAGKKGDSFLCALNSNKDSQLNKPNIENLVNNFERNFLNHANKINKYKEKIEREHPNKEYKVIFLIEDTSKSILEVPHKANNISILNIKEINEILKKQNDLNGVIVYSCSPLGASFILSTKLGLSQIKTYEKEEKDFISYVFQITNLSNPCFQTLLNYLCNLKENCTITDSVTVTKKYTDEQLKQLKEQGYEV